MMNEESSPNHRSRVRGIASGVMFLAFFGTLWASLGINGLQGLYEPWLLMVILLIGVTVLLAGFSLMRATRRLPKAVSNSENLERHRSRTSFRIVFATEGILILIAFMICRAINHFDWFFPVMMLIVGVHFIPLAGLFRVQRYYTAGLLLCLLALLTLFAVPERIQVYHFQILTWWVTLGFGGAIILWGVGFAHWMQGKRLLGQNEK